MVCRVLAVAFLIILSTLVIACRSSSESLFTLLPAEDTGITFANRITDSDSVSILDVEYIYNGGGVALGDFNNDSLPDVFFTGNQVPNRLYLNKGDFKFDDITETAGIAGNGKWCSGATLIDVNNDGWLDVYVSATLSNDATKRQNLLYVNQGAKNGKPVFLEMAREYGIADDSHTTNAAFFDYDNDGDLDLYLLTDRIDEYPNVYRARVNDGSSLNADRLYRNDFDPKRGHPFFTNVSKQAGIVHDGYGLGLNIVDINRDGWKDIYVTNDYLSDDLLYINNHNGTFTDRSAETFKHTSNTAMGNDVTDINNDGLADVIAVDMMPRDNYRKKMLLAANNYQTYLNNDQFGVSYQYVRNTLQLNQGSRPNAGTPAFSEVSLLADVAETDWSWAPMVVDFDNNGFRDLLITNGFPKDVTDRDFMTFHAENGKIATKDYTLAQIPVVKISNYAFRNEGGNVPTFADVTEAWGINNPSFSNGAAYGDLDNDGDLDYVVNNINDSAFVYRNNLIEQKAAKANFLRVKFAGSPQNRMGLGAFVELRYGKTNDQQQLYEHSPYRGYLSTVEPVAHFGLGAENTINEVRITWPATGLQPARQQTLRNVKANQVILAEYGKATESVRPPTSSPASLFNDVTDSLKVAYQHTEPEFIDYNNQKLLPHKLSQYGPSVAVGDINGDGLDDLFIGGSREKQGHFLMQTQTGALVETPGLPTLNTPADKQQEDMGTLLFDADADGDLDLYIASGSVEAPANTPAYQDRLYLNNGKGTFALAPPGTLPTNTTSKSCVRAADFDQDGDLDLFIGGRVIPDEYPKAASSLLLRNDSKPGQPRFTDVTAQLAPGLKDIGLICDALWTDPDNDGDPDLLLVGEWMPITLLTNEKGQLKKATNTALGKAIGWWNSITAGDFDNDGDMDYVAGNLGLNARMRATTTEPVRIYAGDFDNNGFYDAIPTLFFPDADGGRKEYTFHGREDLIKQMIIMRRRFPYYKDFAQASIDKLLTSDELKNALVLEANYLESAYIENKGNGTFALHPLPVQAQLAPIFGMVANDVDRDGNLDVLLVGNDYSGELLAGRYDAMNGLWLRGDGTGQFTPQSIASSGFYVPGNAKGLAQLTGSNGTELVVATQNRGTLRIFRNTKPARHLRLRPTDATALLTFADGKKQKVDCSYGSSFLSQSARVLWLSPQVKSVELTDSQGRKRQAGLVDGLAKQ
ncbi:FG-GAP-like repeat-containing protein [Fibrella aquatica]|uniref:FG-GAP-like repeat-containing protein n=1 Tax=Fibrella aquatica TaxID=3242487 RepID=UPI003521B48F